jgi:hypothetical protein
MTSGKFRREAAAHVLAAGFGFALLLAATHAGFA